jgi:hypothetical protein
MIKNIILNTIEEHNILESKKEQLFLSFWNNCEMIFIKDALTLIQGNNIIFVFNLKGEPSFFGKEVNDAYYKEFWYQADREDVKNFVRRFMKKYYDELL